MSEILCTVWVIEKKILIGEGDFKKSLIVKTKDKVKAKRDYNQSLYNYKWNRYLKYLPLHRLFVF